MQIVGPVSGDHSDWHITQRVIGYLKMDGGKRRSVRGGRLEEVSSFELVCL